MTLAPLAFLLLTLSCHTTPDVNTEEPPDAKAADTIIVKQTAEKSWPYFLQHLPVVDSPVLDYRKRPVDYQQKAVGIIPYDVGKADLQQCADALMRLRAEYLFEQGKHSEIGFHFTSGQYYSWADYCRGLRPVAKGNSVSFVQRGASEKTHTALRQYLDLVYAYASTISLAKELKTADDFEIGTVVIYPGSPGHCFIIIDEAVDGSGSKWFRLAEGYTPAQSIYVLKDVEGTGGPWHHLGKGKIETASYTFTKYKLGKFE